MTTALTAQPEPRAVTGDELVLIKNTIAVGATDAELKLFLFDCARQGVHPLDRLIHFTKRGGKYTPITSIDFMRTRAADTGEYAGSDDADFHDTEPGDDPPGFLASVTVWRLVQGQRCPFVATARWSEYKPDPGPNGKGDVMWLKMPHTMLGKCAEALALRKGFPRQLAGLYAKEEMDQADSPRGYVVEAPAANGPSTALAASTQLDATGPSLGTSVPNVPDSGQLPTGAVYITKVSPGFGKAVGFLHHSGQQVAQGASNDGLPMYQTSVKAMAESCCQERAPVVLEIVTSTTSGKPYVRSLKRVEALVSDTDLDRELAAQALAKQAAELF